MTKDKNISAEQSVGTSVLVSIGDIVINLGLALLSGSAVMLSQALQGTADLLSATLLLVGVKKSSRQADDTHPFGFGREIFFWALLASIFTLVATGIFVVTKGVGQVVAQNKLDYANYAIIVLAFGLLSNGYSMRISLKRIGSGLSSASIKDVINRVIHSSLIETKTTLLIDTMGSVSAAIGLLSLAMYQVTGAAIFDGIGAIAVGLITMAGALLLIYNLKNLLVGVSPRPEVINQIRDIASNIKHVNDVLDLRAITIGSGKILVILEIHFEDKLTTDEIEKITDEIKDALKSQMNIIHRVQVEAETP